MMTSAENPQGAAYPQGKATPVEPDAADTDSSKIVQREQAGASPSVGDGRAADEKSDRAASRHAQSARMRTRTESHPRRGEAHGHQHRDVSGGWLRPAVFGAMDGLVTNVSLISGVGAG